MKKKRPLRQRLPTVLTPGEKAIALGFPMAILVLAVGIIRYGSIEKHEKEMDLTLLKWQQKYHLTDHQRDLVKELELKFHGNGSPFSVPVTHSPEEVHAHHLSISKHMTPENAEIFLKAVKGSTGKH